MNKLIILDRDGVINFDSDEYIKSAQEWEPIPGSLEAIAKFTQLNYKIVIYTNQSAIAKKLITTEILNEIHHKMLKAIEHYGGCISAIIFCPHNPTQNCECRKPKSKMIIDICERFNVENLNKVMLVGDSLRDLQAIYNAGGIPVLVKTGNGKKTLHKDNLPPGTLVFENLLEVSEYLNQTSCAKC